ncbi:Mitochondrial distribution and morphology protein 34 [Grifola frondosa]|uniref:Mitochondrial distribution and morphology protein 34 n=1 Tax=Grifola frondosa TaxID=5627 RepID=A0A1C7M1Z0_GRIFR|nr:Mitochondrial distribution and morphology protein 34 [Grifola frondosa]
MQNISYVVHLQLASLSPTVSCRCHPDARCRPQQGQQTPVIADKIEVVELEMGTQPPELEIRDIGELTMDQFRGIFRLTYAGDAHIVLRTKVQANPLNHKQPDLDLMGGSRGMLAAKQPLVVPMLLRLSHFKLNAYVVLVVSRQKGITLVFKTDPLQNVDINSTFDSIAVIQKFIQREIEGQLRQMFREDLPGIIHRLSQQWVKAKVEAPYLERLPALPRQRNSETASNPDLSSYRISRIPSVGVQSVLRRPTYSLAGHARTRSSYSSSSVGRKPSTSAVSSPPLTTSPPPASDSPSSFPDIENFDPTYGLRPEGLPAKSVFSGFRNLFAQNRGLADLTEEPSEIDGTETGSFDVANWDDLLSEYDPGASVSEAGDITEYESVPAVGGGTITRPRIYHSQSQIRTQSREGATPSPSRKALSPRGSITASVPSVLSPRPRSPPRASSQYDPYFAGATPHYRSAADVRTASEGPWMENSMDQNRFSSQFMPPVPALDYSTLRRAGSSSSLHTQRSSDMTHSIPTPPAPEEEGGVHINRPRRSSISSNLDNFVTGSPDQQYHIPEHDPQIILRPSLNSTISKLSTLSHSYHTLSPYTRTLEHFTVRSVPPREATSSGPTSCAEKQPVKARRKRIHRLGGKPAKPPEPKQESSPPSPEHPVSEFDASEMDRYFRSRDDLIPRYPNLHASHVRRRFPYEPS